MTPEQRTLIDRALARIAGGFASFADGHLDGASAKAIADDLESIRRALRLSLEPDHRATSQRYGVERT